MRSRRSCTRARPRPVRSRRRRAHGCTTPSGCCLPGEAPRLPRPPASSAHWVTPRSLISDGRSTPGGRYARRPLAPTRPETVEADKILAALRPLVLVVDGTGTVVDVRGGYGGFRGHGPAGGLGASVFDHIPSQLVGKQNGRPSCGALRVQLV